MRRFIFKLLFIIPLFFPVLQVQASPQANLTANDLISAINALRSGAGVSPLETDGSLMAAAQSHSEYQAAIGAWSHTGSGGSTPGSRAIAAGYGGGGKASVSENVAVVSPTATTDNIINEYWADAVHRNTMLNPQYQHAGVGIAESGGQIYITLDVGYTSGGGSVVKPVVTSAGETAAPSTSTTRQSNSSILTCTPMEDGSVVHEVKAGQALWNIATAYGAKVNDIITLNHLPPSPILLIGQKLVIFTAPSATDTPLPTETPRPATKTPIGTRSPRPTLPLVTSSPVAQTTDASFMDTIRPYLTLNRQNMGIVLIAACGVGLFVLVITSIRRR